VIEPFRAYVDESLRLSARLYLMAAVFVDGARAESHRTVLRGLLRKGQRRLHWRDEDDRRRAALIEAVAALRPRGIVVIGTGMDPRHQERARRKCMERLLWNLYERGIAEAVFERRSNDLDNRDRQMVAMLRGRHLASSRLPVLWESPEAEPLLWLPDLVAGAASMAEGDSDAFWKEIEAGLSIDRFNIG
jgi:hypothetical protein